ncbi:MAG: hypothetical protein GWM98_14045 [Nitrospinaceae bacterium]|nr:hypothetical protein [Nitrospinaceae bacterium]NIR55393.1 hypothetical protein [Nitrospinaceae bacterium]NIT82679.1 hypothetical protein [Nitrospinaceae bacterium]NIW06467.1 hypothetical protein [Nitrospinaceae bacterium]NIX35039.1 hypothetical protein [Nitrospinaceae bacterium]
MVDTFARELDCVLCQNRYSPVIEPGEDQSSYDIYCTSCVKWVRIAKSDPVRSTLRTVLKLDGEPLALAIQNYLSTCPCGNEFSHDAGKRCPECIHKIKRETHAGPSSHHEFHCIWNIQKLKDIEGRVFEYILDRLTSEEENLSQLIDRYEKGEIDPGTYMEGVERIQMREATEVAVIKTWAMLAGPEMAFRAAEEHGLLLRYGSRILISIASGLEMGYGTSILTTLSKEEKNLDGAARKEIQTFLKKIAGGF